FVHTTAENWPWHGYVLAAHLLRALNGLLGLGTLLFVYGSGRFLWPDSSTKAVLATALIAFLPQFTFLHGAINNDGLLICLSSATLWQLLRIWYKPLVKPRDLLLLGTTIALAILTKMTGLLLLVLAVMVIVLWWFSRQPSTDLKSSTRIKQLLLLILPVLLISGWLFWRNWTLYGDPTAANQFVILARGDRQYTLRQVWADMDRVWLSLFAVFGWMNVRPPTWVYGVWQGIVLAAAAGGGWVLARSRQRPLTVRSTFLQSPAPWLAAWVGLVLVAWLRFMMQTPADQGRLLFPAILPLALAAAHGLSQLRSRIIPWLAAILALSTTLTSLFFVVPQAYARPRIITTAEIPTTAHLLYEEMAEGLILVAGEANTAVSHPQQLVPFTLYWQATQPLTTAPTVVLKLFGRDQAVLDSQHGYHGRGLYPATLWPQGDAIIVEEVFLRPDAATAVPT
ncbi:MAG: DUF2142 domain-containing protein, partial [Anaerolineales bacterium]|nr:DUF2142 domain-containing protein [Anaerolineales bacterium]